MGEGIYCWEMLDSSSLRIRFRRMIMKQVVILLPLYISVEFQLLWDGRKRISSPSVDTALSLDIINHWHFDLLCAARSVRQVTSTF